MFDFVDQVIYNVTQEMPDFRNSLWHTEIRNYKKIVDLNIALDHKRNNYVALLKTCLKTRKISLISKKCRHVAECITAVSILRYCWCGSSHES